MEPPKSIPLLPMTLNLCSDDRSVLRKIKNCGLHILKCGPKETHLKVRAHLWTTDWQTELEFRVPSGAQFQRAKQ